MTATFFQDLRSFSAFEDVVDDVYFSSAPKEWWVIVTDVAGSTAAIEAGRYRDVNTVGAMGIAAIQAALPDVMFPFVFGGDGASAMIPRDCRSVAESVLADVTRLARDQFQLELRVGIISIDALAREGYEVHVGKFQLRHGYPLAVFRGQGIKRAEELLKSDQLPKLESSPGVYADLSQLMCLWKPINSQRGQILTVLVDVISEPQIESETLSRVLQELRAVFRGDIEVADPLQIDAMVFQSLPTLLVRERRFQWGLGKYLRRVIIATMMWLLCGTRLHRVLPYLRRFIAEFHEDSDFRKLEQALALVLDCAPEELEAIDKLLKRLHSEGLIYYGLHRSSECLMTCFVPAPTLGEHIAFVDGGDGGYAMAAKALKAQRASGRS